MRAIQSRRSIHRDDQNTARLMHTFLSVVFPRVLPRDAPHTNRLLQWAVRTLLEVHMTREPYDLVVRDALIDLAAEPEAQTISPENRGFLCGAFPDFQAALDGVSALASMRGAGLDSDGEEGIDIRDTDNDDDDDEECDECEEEDSDGFVVSDAESIESATPTPPQVGSPPRLRPLPKRPLVIVPGRRRVTLIPDSEEESDSATSSGSESLPPGSPPPLFQMDDLPESGAQ